MTQPLHLTPVSTQQTASPPTLVDLVGEMAQSKVALDMRATLIRASMAGALLGLATCLSYLAMQGLPDGQARLMAGLVFPVGFMVIMLMRLELIAGNFTVVSLGALAGRLSLAQLLRNWSWVYFGNFCGALLLGLLLMLTLSPDSWLAQQLQSMAQAKTLLYQQAGLAGWLDVFVRGILCNWLVSVAVVLGISIASVPGKIIAAWLPLMNFMALGFEHAVVNLFVIPTGMLLGADISIEQWLLWNFLPVTLGNLIGGLLISLSLHYGWKK